MLACHRALVSNAFTQTAGPILLSKGKTCVCRQREKIYKLWKFCISEMWFYSCQSTCNVCSLLLPYTKWFHSLRKNRLELQKRHPHLYSCSFYTSAALQRAEKFQRMGKRGWTQLPSKLWKRWTMPVKLTRTKLTYTQENVLMYCSIFWRPSKEDRTLVHWSCCGFWQLQSLVFPCLTCIWGSDWKEEDVSISKQSKFLSSSSPV